MSGSALFADISGFTALTEALAEILGARRGAEEIASHLNRVYNALILEVERFGGNVISFAGDGIMCWFDSSQAMPEYRAVSCAMALQSTMNLLVPIPVPVGDPMPLAIKVAVTSGNAHRFSVGNPMFNYIDILAGNTIEAASWGENMANKDEVLVDELTARTLQKELTISEWRKHPQKEGATFGVVKKMQEGAYKLSGQKNTTLPPVEKIRSWVIREVYEKEQAGHTPILAELRPCTAIFVRFSGIDYDALAANDKLNELIHLIQASVERFGGTLLEVVIGDKGSYAYINIGALGMHEDGPRRAIKLALTLREETASLRFKPKLQIGITQGTMFVGPYGSASRKTFGALGGDVNLSARLMISARMDEILISSRVRRSITDEFIVEAQKPMLVKGKTEPLPVFSVISLKQQRAIRLQEPVYELPMIGRDNELSIIFEKISQTIKGHGQVIGITGEAGMGKSRLISEGIRLANQGGFIGFGGTCKSDGIHTPYLVWHSIWNAFFDIDPGTPLQSRMDSISRGLEKYAPEYLDSMPLLGPVLGLKIPENDLTHALQPKDRRRQLGAMLLKCLETAATETAQSGGGVLLVLEDMHWIDPASSNLLDFIAQSIAHLPILILISYRIPEIDSHDPGVNNLKEMDCFTYIRLMDLNREQSEEIVHGKVMQLFPENGKGIPQALIARITQRAQGNPFYVEELLNYLHDSGIDPQDEKTLNRMELPSSLQSLILSRIDRLSPSQQLLFKVASVIGRAFKIEDLLRYYPWSGVEKELKQDTQTLIQADLFSVDVPEPDLHCFFKHLVTHEVSYENIAFATRKKLHGLYANYLEQIYGENIEQLTPQLAHHFDRAQIKDKAAFYLYKAGEQAAGNFANDEALVYFNRALKFADSMPVNFQYDVLLKRERVFDILGRRKEQLKDLDELSRLAKQFDNSVYLKAQLDIRRARLGIDEGDYSAAKTAAQAAIHELNAAPELQDEYPNLLVDALWLQARAMFYAGQAIAAKPFLDTALELAQEHNYIRGEYNTVGQLGLWYWYNNDNETARKMLLQSLDLIRSAGDIRRELDMLINLGVISKDMYLFTEALSCYEQAQKIAKRIGDRTGEATLLNNMGRASLVSGDFVGAIQYCTEAASVAEEVNDTTTQGLAAFNQGDAYRNLGQYQFARDAMNKALGFLQTAGYRRGEADALEYLARIEYSLGNMEQAFSAADRALVIAREIDSKSVEISVMTRIGIICFNTGEIERAKQVFTNASRIEEEYQEPILRYELAAGLAASLLEGEGEDAKDQVAELLEDLIQEILQEPQTEQSHFIPMGLYLICMQAKYFDGDIRLGKLVERTKQELLHRSNKISDPAMRNSYPQIPEHQAINNFQQDSELSIHPKIGPISI